MRQLSFFFLLLPFMLSAQEKQEGRYNVDAAYFYGNIIPHNKLIKHLITSHQQGLIVSFNKRTFGDREWEAVYNYPDYGASFHYQALGNENLGDMYGLYGHYSFYFLNRRLMFRVGQGISYNTNPYDRNANFRNYAYSTHLMPSSYFMLNYQKPDLWQGFGIQAGLTFMHHSNANLKAPNTSTNTFAVTAGVNYTFGKEEGNTYKPYLPDSTAYSKNIKYNIAFRGGVNEGDIIGSGRYPYFALSLYADKRLSRKSALQLGADFFWPKYLKEYIYYKSVAFPEENINGDTDYRKIGVFAGHELFVNKLSLETQVGIYVYSPFNSTGRLYERVGLKYYPGGKVFAAISLKAHGAQAEVLEIGVGIRL